MPKLRGSVIEGTLFEGEVNTAINTKTFFDDKLQQDVEKTQLEVEIINPATGQKALSWFNLPKVDEEGYIGDIRVRSGLGMLLQDIKRLTGREIQSGDEVQDFVQESFEGKIVKGIVYDEFTWKGLPLTNVAKFQEVA